MLVRLLFDENEDIEGFWIARDPKGPTPRGFKKGGISSARRCTV